MKPFLLIQIRESDEAVAGEYESVLRFSGLPRELLVNVRAEQEPLPPIDMADYSGIFIGGGPFNASDDVKSINQVRVEAELGALLDAAIEAEFPVLGICYGVGILTTHLGGIVDRTYPEGAGAVEVTLTDAGRLDPLFDGVNDRFSAFTGPKEACTVLPPEAVVLASGTACPVQAFRVGSHLYAVQFHVELDIDALVERMTIYQHHGYFNPDELDGLIEAARVSGVTEEPGRVLANFVRMVAAEQTA